MNNIYLDLDGIVKKIHDSLFSWAQFSGDRDIPAWNDLTEESKIMGRASLIRHMGLPFADLQVEANHNWWRDWALKNNWHYGPSYNDSSCVKTNPRLLPFDDLTKTRKTYSDIVISEYRLWLPRMQAAYGIEPVSPQTIFNGGSHNIMQVS